MRVAACGDRCVDLVSPFKYKSFMFFWPRGGGIQDTWWDLPWSSTFSQIDGGSARNYLGKCKIGPGR